MPRRIDLRNQQFGQLTALEPLAGNMWKCQCSCGNFKAVATASLRNGNTKSCGCLREKNPGRPVTKQPKKKFIPFGYFHDHTVAAWESIENELNRYEVMVGKIGGGFYFYVHGKAAGPYPTKIHAMAAALLQTIAAPGKAP